VARPQMLYVGNQGAIIYPAIGNAEIGAGDKGTVSFWYHPCSTDVRNSLWRVTVDDENLLQIRRYRQQYLWETVADGAIVGIDTTSDTVAWRLIVGTWDFSGGAGNGVLRLYLDGQEVPESPATSATAPIGPASEMRVGPGTSNSWSFSHAVYDGLSIWDEVMTAEQVSALYAKGRRHTPQESDGAGRLLFRASWDGQYDAEIAEGGGTATPQGEADQYCRLDIGGSRHGQRFGYRLGTPKHDDSENDRVPLFAVLARTNYGGVTVTNGEEWSVLAIDASNSPHPVGASLAPWLSPPTEPMTLSFAVHVASEGVPMNTAISIGPLSYYHGTGKDFLCDTGCTTSTLTSEGLWESEDFWAGAEVSVITGPASGQKLKALSYDASTRTITVDGQFSEAPESGNVAIVEFPRRAEPFQAGGSNYRLECDLSQSHDGIERFSVVECAVGGVMGYFCVDKGRIQQYPSTVDGGEVFFGKRGGDVIEEWTCDVLLERIEIEGPGLCQSTDGADDAFMVKDPDTGESTKVWRADAISRITRQPTQYSSPSQVQDEFTEAGTWREALQRFPDWMEYDRANDRLIAAVVGEDAGGVARVGYIWGTWNESTGRVEWTDDPDPGNPVFELEALEEVLEGKGNLYNRFVSLGGVFETVEGSWAMTFIATVGDPDGYVTCALTGAPDKYSFDPAVHFHPEDNPLTPFYGGRDKVVPEGGGIGFFANRDAAHQFVRNRYAADPSRRFWGYARAKAVLNYDAQYQEQLARPLACVVTGDFKNVRNVPWRNTNLVPRYGWFHYPYPQWYSASTLGLIVDDGGVNESDVNLYVAEDGVHLLKPLAAPLIPRNSPPFNAAYLSPVSLPVRLGKRRLYWYREGKSGNNFNLAVMRLDEEALYVLNSGETSGELETCELRKPTAGWSELKVNVDPKEGQVRVAVIDADTEEPIAGYGYSDCDSIGEGVGVRITWNTAGLSEVTAERIRLRFEFSRSTPANGSPELYSWAALPPDASERPRCSDAKVEGETNPTKVANPKPRFSWTYEDPGERPQSAFHILVAASQEKLDENVGDLWDSGIVFSESHEAKYDGTELSGDTTYFWKVSVRNSEGAWSEAW